MKFFKYLVFSFLIFSFSQSINTFAAENKEKKQLSEKDQYKFDMMLTDGARSNNINQVKEALKNGANINFIDALCGFTALTYASGNGYENIIEFLLGTGAIIDFQNHSGETALMWTTWKGYKNILRLLLNRGANPNITNHEGQTSADIAKKKKHYEIEKILRAVMETRRVAVQKEITEGTPLIPELADIVSEYTECSKLEKIKSKE